MHNLHSQRDLNSPKRKNNSSSLRNKSSPKGAFSLVQEMWLTDWLRLSAELRTLI